MDPITTAVIAALEAGANSAAGDVAKNALVDCYDGLKALLKKRFGSESDIAQAVEKLQEKPDAKGRRQTVEDEVKVVNADADSELLAAARSLLDQIRSQRDGEKHIQHVQGDFNAVTDRGGSANVTIHGSVSKLK